MRDLRTKKLGLTQEQLAIKLGVSQETVRRWEKGKHPIPYATQLYIQILTTSRQ